ncbi:MAG: hypothetical protein M1826_004651 [Phylliscum demangeonii]|nr:MAG: hypothetical protein M1826_004651 [Phylliscum demangeonii]
MKALLALLLPTLLPLSLLFITAASSLPLPARDRFARVPPQQRPYRRTGNANNNNNNNNDDSADYGLARLRTTVQRALPLTVGVGVGTGANLGARLGPEEAAVFSEFGAVAGSVTGLGVGVGEWLADRATHLPCTPTSDQPPNPPLLAGVAGALGPLFPRGWLTWRSSAVGGAAGVGATWFTKRALKAMDPQAGACPLDRL